MMNTPHLVEKIGSQVLLDSTAAISMAETKIADIGTKAITLAALEPIMKLIYVEVSE